MTFRFGRPDREEDSYRNILERIERKADNIMAQIDELMADFADMKTNTAAAAASTQKKLDDLQALVTAGATPTDLTAAIDAASAENAALLALGAEVPTPPTP